MSRWINIDDLPTSRVEWDATCTDIVNIAAHVDCVTLQLKYAKVED